MKTAKEAVQAVGSGIKTAAICGVSRARVYQWINANRIPVHACPAIELASDGRVKCEELRDDVTFCRDALGRVTGYVTAISNASNEQRLSHP